MHTGIHTGAPFSWQSKLSAHIDINTSGLPVRLRRTSLIAERVFIMREFAHEVNC